MIVTYSIYLIFLKVVNYRVSYTIAYITGIAVAYVLNKIFVFNTNNKLISIFLYPFIYFIQYLSSLLILWILVSQLRLRVELGPLVIGIISIPLTYWLNRLVFIGTQADYQDVVILKK
jgi:putative flippase GtrA